MAQNNLWDEVNQSLQTAPRLFIEGHHHRRGYAISRDYSDEEIRALPALTEIEPPIRFYTCPKRARRLVERFNRMTRTTHLA